MAAGERDGAIEASAEVAGHVVKGLGSNPVLLAIVVLVMIGTVANYLFVDHLLSRAHERALLVLEKCFDVQQGRSRREDRGAGLVIPKQS